MKVGSVFSGIGGFDLGLEQAGMEIQWQIENDRWCNKILARHWPDVKRYGDVATVDPNELERVDLICRRCHMRTDGRLEEFRELAKRNQPRAVAARWR